MKNGIPSDRTSSFERRTESRRIWRAFKRNRLALVGLVIVTLVVLTVVFADDWFIAIFQGRDPQPLLAPYDPAKQNMEDRLASPSRAHPMGADEYGRDILSRVIYGGRVSLVVGVCSIILGCVAGTFLGLVAAYAGGYVETGIMRGVDALRSFPNLILALLLLTVFGAGPSKIIVAIAVGFTAQFARLAHSATLSVKQCDYIAAARAVGASPFRIVFRHILPNIAGEVVVISTLWTASAIRYEASLSFLGLGVSPPTAAWGIMIYMGKTYLRDAPWLSVYPGLAILVTILGYNMLGDGFRDVLDPRLQEGRVVQQ